MSTHQTCSAVCIPSIIACIASKLSSNEAACLRVVNKDASEALSEHATIQLSQPVPIWAYKEHWSQPGACKGLTRAQRRQLVSLTASSNIVPNLEAALEASGLPPCGKALEAAAGSGALDSCRWLVDSSRLAGPVDVWKIMPAAISTGQGAVCDWCLEHFPPPPDSPGPYTDRFYNIMASYAARHGHVGLMDKMLAAARDPLAGDVGYKCDLFLDALHGCDLATVQRVQELCGGPSTWDSVYVYWDEYGFHSPIAAALSSQTPDWQAKAEWLLTQGIGLSPSDPIGPSHLPNEAAIMERFAWLKAQKYEGLLRPGDTAILGPYVEAGHAQALEWLIAAGVTPGPPGCPNNLVHDATTAAREGHLAALQVLARSPWHSRMGLAAVIEAAAAAGRLEVLAWVLEAFRSDWDAACARTPGLLTWAARSGSVEAIRWVHSHGGGVMGQEAAWSGAVESGCQAAVEVLAELGCPMPSDGSPYARALELREWALLPLLHAQGVPMGGWAPERPLLARALEAGAAPASLLQGLAGEG